MPAYCHPAAYAAFAREMGRIETAGGLFRAAVAIARHEHPEASLTEAEATVRQLAATVSGRLRSDSPQAKLAHLHDVMFDVVGFAGNVEDYYNPANSYLPIVLATHRGIPITLVLIYKCVAEQVGLKVRGINAPGHFLAAVHCPEPVGGEPLTASATTKGWQYVDPFYGGSLLDEAEALNRISDAAGREVPASLGLLAPATHRQWLARMLNNLQAVFAHTGRERDLYAMQELQTLLAT